MDTTSKEGGHMMLPPHQHVVPGAPYYPPVINTGYNHTYTSPMYRQMYHQTQQYMQGKNSNNMDMSPMRSTT
eukprot:scaffold657107_cov63-Attheya_sp.AAC.1